jgi:hypothetical protein
VLLVLHWQKLMVNSPFTSGPAIVYNDLHVTRLIEPYLLRYVTSGLQEYYQKKHTALFPIHCTLKLLMLCAKNNLIYMLVQKKSNLIF